MSRDCRELNKRPEHPSERYQRGVPSEATTLDVSRFSPTKDCRPSRRRNSQASGDLSRRQMATASSRDS